MLFSLSEDNRVKMWDIRSAKGSLMVLDQHNADTTGGPQSGEGFYENIKWEWASFYCEAPNCKEHFYLCE